MTLTGAFTVFAILIPEAIQEVLQVIGSLSNYHIDQALLSSYDPKAASTIQNEFPWVTLSDAISLSKLWQKKGMPQEVVEQFNYALLTGASILALKDVSEEMLNVLGQVLIELLSPSDKRYLYSEDRLGHRGFWALAISQENELLKPLGGHYMPVDTVQYSSDGHRILTTSYDHTINVWKEATGEQLFSIEGSWPQFSPDGKSILVTMKDEGVVLLHAQTGQKRSSLLGSLLGHSPDRRYIATLVKSTGKGGKFISGMHLLGSLSSLCLGTRCALVLTIGASLCMRTLELILRKDQHLSGIYLLNNNSSLYHLTTIPPSALTDGVSLRPN